FKQKIRILNPDKKTALMETPDQEFELKETKTPFMAVNYFAEVVIQKPGTYWFQNFLNNKLVMEFPMEARKMEPKTQETEE
ncbi:MAG: hypothetical protein ACLFQV_03065, partial [Vulcanimicrobiota bacterium]